MHPRSLSFAGGQLGWGGGGDGGSFERKNPISPRKNLPIECAASALPKPSFFCAPAVAVPSGGGVLVVADCVSVVSLLVM